MQNQRLYPLTKYEQRIAADARLDAFFAKHNAAHLEWEKEEAAVRKLEFMWKLSTEQEIKQIRRA